MLKALLFAFVIQFVCGPLQAQTSSLSLSAVTNPLVVNTASAGREPDTQRNNSTRLSFTVMNSAAKVFASLETPLPPAVSLRLHVEAPPGAFDLGWTELDSEPREIIRDIPAGTYSGLVITYELSAKAAAGVLPLSRVNVVFFVSN
jgi:hypothetical protein